MLLLGLVLVPCTAARLVDVRSARHSDFTRIVFETDEKVSYAIENRSAGKERAIELTLPATASEMILRAVHEPALSVQVETTEAGSRSLVRVSGPVDVWTNQLGNPPRVVLDLRVAEPVAARDPEKLDALDYQIVVEADRQVALPAPDPAPAPSTPAVEASPEAAEPSVDRPIGWARSPHIWWGLVAIALLFLVVLWFQRLAARARRAERVVPPPVRPPVVSPPAAQAEPKVKETPMAQEPKAPENPPPPPPAAKAAPPAPEPRVRSEGTRELFELFSRMEERLAVLERQLRDTRAEGRELHERSVAQAEELRAHRVAMAKLLRRPTRGNSPALSSSRSPSSS